LPEVGSKRFGFYEKWFFSFLPLARAMGFLVLFLEMSRKGGQL